jgi:hypothetical protein
MQSAKRINLSKAWRLTECLNRNTVGLERPNLNVYVVRSYVSSTQPLLKDDKKTTDDTEMADKIKKQNELIRILNQKKRDMDLLVVSGANKSGDSTGNTVNGSTNGSDDKLGSKSEGTSSGSNGRTFHCPKCGALCTHVDSLVSLSRFVKCEKCNHFFVIMAEDRKPVTFFTERQAQSPQQQQQEQQKQFKPTPPPPPKKIWDFLNKYIIGQDHSKKVISVAVYNHYKRINNNMLQAQAAANKKAQQSSENAPPLGSQQNITNILSGTRLFQLNVFSLG